jgi:hypothetical protein
MTYSELKETLKEHAESNAWLHDDTKGIWTLKSDLNVTIREKRGEDDQDDFQEEWAKRVPDKSAKMVEFDLYYGASFVETHYIVGVDGFRALLPLPKLETETIARDKYVFAKCIDFQNSLDEYIERCRLTVE